MTHPDTDDIVVRQNRSNPHVVYILGTPATPDQSIFQTLDEGVRQALAFAEYQHVRAWFDEGDDTFVLFGTFRNEEVKPTGHPDGESREQKDRQHGHQGCGPQTEVGGAA